MDSAWASAVAPAGRVGNAAVMSFADNKRSSVTSSVADSTLDVEYTAPPS